MVNNISKYLLYPCLFVLATALTVFAQSDALKYAFDKKIGQVEVGGRYAGAEFHESRPLPSRVSLYYPVANSIDLSTDYWKRGDSRPFAIGVQVGDAPRAWLGRDGWTYKLSPHTVTFHSTEGDVEYVLRYEFCGTMPAMVMTLMAINRATTAVDLKLYTHIKNAIRTCQTFARKDSAVSSFDAQSQAMRFDFHAPDAGNASLFVVNEGDAPAGWTTSSMEVAATDSGTSNWISSTGDLGKRTFPTVPGPVIAAFEYRKHLSPGEYLSVIQIIGSTLPKEVNGLIAEARKGWRKDVTGYNADVERYAAGDTKFATGDPSIDRSVVWAKGILAANQHNLNGTIIPMPCPAEYNFFFTHDVLMTDLGAVNFDLPRVKRDLLYIGALVKPDSIIPHAFYWRDDGYKIEFCTPENWNHLWFVLTTASYLRHSNDAATCKKLYKYVAKSMSEILTQYKSDNLMYAYRPDWWDIGHREGSRSYITILTIRALKDFMYLTASLGENTSRLARYESMAGLMESALGSTLWDPSLKYLINFNETEKDTHFYMGSLLAPVYGVLDYERSRELVQTAEQQMVRAPVGVMVATPPDFNTPANNAFFKFVGNEAGDPYFYINGGIWPHANAWYSLALQAVGRPDDALNFVRSSMTIDGVVNSPNGIPAMYEYRFSDTASHAFGTIDKPSFMWAGGFYLNVLYHLAGFSDNEWNVSLAASVPTQWKHTECSYMFGSKHDVAFTGTPGRTRSLSVSGEDIPSLILPLDKQKKSGLSVEFGPVKRPYLESMNAIVHHAAYGKSKNELVINVSSFPGHAVTANFVAPPGSFACLLDGVDITKGATISEQDGYKTVAVHFNAKKKHQEIKVRY